MRTKSLTLEKERKEEIAKACETLYETKSFKDITVRDIGNLTSFGRTSIYNYFRSKEEIFLTLLEMEYQAWIDAINKVTNSYKNLTCEQFAAAIAHTMEKRKLLLKIMSMNHFDMEENCREERLVEFKTAYGNSMRAMLTCLHKFFPEMTIEEGQDFLYSFFPFMYGIYPYTTVTKAQRNAMKKAEVNYVYMSIYEITYNFLLKILGCKEKSN